jgi:hypothetical protein
VRASSFWPPRCIACQRLPNGLTLTAIPVRTWCKRFPAAALAGLADKSRARRPATYSTHEVAEVIATALIPPEQLGLPFASWTLDRLEAYLKNHKAIAIK